MNLAQALQIQPGEVIALVGGGGKTAAMFRLGRTLALSGRRVLLTTTTRIAAKQVDLAPATVTFDPDTETLAQVLPKLQQALDHYNQVLLIRHIDATFNQAIGVPPHVIDFFAEADVCDVIINEADGAKKRPFKAPAAYEPVIPDKTSLVVPMVGLDVVGQPLTEASVHRVDQISRLSQTLPGQLINLETIASVLTHPAGGLKDIPALARVVPFLNKFELSSPATATALAKQILQNTRIQAVGIGSANQDNGVRWVQNRVAAVILAAGQARRFGSPKQLALWQGKPLLAHAVDAALAAQAHPIIVVLGAYADACREVLDDKPVEIVLNENWAAGQSTSVQAGLAALPSYVSAALFPLADQPRVTANVIDAVITTYQQTLAPIVWPEFEGKRGNPVLFDRCLFSEMNQITGDMGAKPVLKAYRDQAEQVAVSEAGILQDVDTPDDL